MRSILLFWLLPMLTSLISAEEVFVEHLKRRLAVFHGDHVDCDLTGGKDRVQHLLQTTYADKKVQLVSRSEMQQIIRGCELIHQSLHNEADNEIVIERRKDMGDLSNARWLYRILNQLLIVPGTKWCGAGDVADHYNDLGVHAEEDKCCRDHDLCLGVSGEYIAPGQCRNGLCNHSPVTRSPCHCDYRFMSCLRSHKSRVSDAIGRMFFNIAGMTCYKLDYPVKRCAEFVQPTRARVPPWILTATNINKAPQRPICRRYELDTSRPKIWQFFQTVYEESTSSIRNKRTNSGNQRSEEARSLGTQPRRRQHRSMGFFQRLMLDIFLHVTSDPRTSK